MKAILGLLLCIPLLHSLRASDETIRVTFTTLGWDRTNETLYYQSQGQPYQPIVLNPRSRSQAYSYTGPNPLTFFIARKGSQGETQYLPIVSASLPAESGEYLLLFVPSPEKRQFEVFALDDSLASFPWGSVRFFNMTSRNLGLLFDGEKIPLRPLEARTSSSKTDRKRVHLAILAIRDEKLRDIYNAQWGQDSRSRNLVFIKDTTRRVDGVETRTISEFSAQ